MIKMTMNPFSCDTKKCYLFDITSGKSKSNEVASFLLNVESISQEAYKKFIEECIKDTRRPENLIKSYKIHTFATGNTTFKHQGKYK